MNNRLYVGNLSWDTNEDGLRAAFGQHGEVTDCKLITDRDTGRSRGFAFVTLSSEEEATAAIAALHGATLDGRELKVNVAEERGNRSERKRW